MSMVAFAAVVVACASVAVPANAARTETVLYSFCHTSGCPDGRFPYAPMVQDAKGNLYGTALAGGNSSDAGTIYELQKVKKSWVFHLLYTFCSKANCADGNAPTGGLIIDTSGTLYGSATLGGSANKGVVFELRRNGKYKVLYNFCSQPNCADGALPSAGLTYQGQQSGQLYDGISTLYGTTGDGGPANWGLVYAITPDGPESLFYGFGADNNVGDGRNPIDPPIMDSAGNLYGTTGGGGSENVGTIFSISPSGSETTLFSFCSQTGYCAPYPGEGALLMTPAGALVGTVDDGGMYDSGVVYSFAAGTYEALANFCNGSTCPNGGNARGGLIEDSFGNLYGVAPLGGNGQDAGTVFEFTGSRLRALYSFCALANCTDGKAPYSKLIMNSRGQLLGTTGEGGAYNEGTIFELL